MPDPPTPPFPEISNATKPPRPPVLFSPGTLYITATTTPLLVDPPAGHLAFQAAPFQVLCTLIFVLFCVLPRKLPTHWQWISVLQLSK